MALFTSAAKGREVCRSLFFFTVYITLTNTRWHEQPTQVWTLSGFIFTGACRCVGKSSELRPELLDVQCAVSGQLQMSCSASCTWREGVPGGRSRTWGLGPGEELRKEAAATEAVIGRLAGLSTEWVGLSLRTSQEPRWRAEARVGFSLGGAGL